VLRPADEVHLPLQRRQVEGAAERARVRDPPLDDDDFERADPWPPSPDVVGMDGVDDTARAAW
jgi:hypothetical protein